MIDRSSGRVVRPTPGSVRARLALALPAAILAACVSAPERLPPKTEPAPSSAQAQRPGGYYLDDGPDSTPPAGVENTPDAVPRAEPVHPFANRPYAVFGTQYIPDTVPGRYRATGIASWYGKRFHGQRTSSGEIYDMYKMTAAHRTLPIPSYARVTNVSNGRSVIVRVNDRGPFLRDRIVDLSYTAAMKLGMLRAGNARVEIESIVPPEAADATRAPASAPPKTGDVTPGLATATRVWLQLGAFSGLDKAQAFCGQLAPRLGSSDPVPLVQAGGGLYRVRLGPYQDSSEATRVAQRLGPSLGFVPLVSE